MLAEGRRPGVSLDRLADVRGTCRNQARLRPGGDLAWRLADVARDHGKPAKTKWARGDVQFIGRGVAHEAKNTGGKPVDMIIVAIK